MTDERLVYPFDNLDPELRRRRELNAEAMERLLPEYFELRVRYPYDDQDEEWCYAAVLARLGVHRALVDEFGHTAHVRRYLRFLYAQGREPRTLYDWQLQRVCMVIERGLRPGWRNAA